MALVTRLNRVYDRMGTLEIARPRRAFTPEIELH